MRHQSSTRRLSPFALALGAALTGCTTDDNPDITGPGLDSGAVADAGAPSADATVAGDSGAWSDAGAESGSDAAAPDSGDAASVADAAADAGAPPIFALVHAAPDVPGVRFCFGVSAAGGLSGSQAKPALAGGLPFGAGGALTVAASQAALLAATNLYIWAIPAASIAAAGDGGSGSSDCGTAYALPGSMLFDMIPAGTFRFNHSYIVAMVGCQTPDVDGGDAICGDPSTDGGTIAFPSGPVLGNLRLEIIDVDNVTPVPEDAIGAQFLHLSPSLEAVVPGGIVPGITSPGDAGAAPDAGDAAAPVADDYADSTTTPVHYNGVYVGPPGSTLAEPPQTFTGTAIAAASLSTAGIGLRTSSLVAPAPSLASIPLASVALATLGLVDGAAPAASDSFATGQSYTFIAVGNVGQTPATSSTFFRIIALPSVH